MLQSPQLEDERWFCSRLDSFSKSCFAFLLFQPDVLCQNAVHCVLKVIQAANFCLLFTQHGALARGGKTWNAYQFIVLTENIKDRGSGQL